MKKIKIPLDKKYHLDIYYSSSNHRPVFLRFIVTPTIRYIIALSVTSSGVNCAEYIISVAGRASRSSFVPSRVTQSQLSSAAHERHVSIVAASERTSRTLLRTIVCKSARIERRGTDRSFASDRLSLLAPGLEGRSR